MKKILLFAVALIFASVLRAQTQDTLVLLFNFNEASLTDIAKTAVADMMHGEKNIAGSKYKIIGFADYRGSAEVNKFISKKRAENVKQFLLGWGAQSKAVTICEGRGKIDHGPAAGYGGIPRDRKVLVVATRPAEQKKKEVKHNNKIDVVAMKKNETVALQNLQFVPGMAILLPSSEPELMNLYQLMADNPHLKIQIEGHICCVTPRVGKDTLQNDPDQQLSETRAMSVYNYLVAKGIQASRMKYIGLGFTHPLFYPETDDEQRRQNRRVEIRILSK